MYPRFLNLAVSAIELFKYYVDTENDMIYFADNPNPTIEEPLRCGKVHILSSDLKLKLSNVPTEGI